MSNELLDAPCVFCLYNGRGYYQHASHHQSCPWYHVGGADERDKLLRATVTTIYAHRDGLRAKLDAVTQERDALRSSVIELLGTHGEPCRVPGQCQARNNAQQVLATRKETT